MRKSCDYVVFDFHEGTGMGAFELEQKLDELGAQGYNLIKTYRPLPNGRGVRFIMQRDGSIVL